MTSAEDLVAALERAPAIEMTHPLFLHYDRAALDAEHNNRAKVKDAIDWCPQAPCPRPPALGAHGLPAARSPGWGQATPIPEPLTRR
jgi:hypothetical protein